MKDLVQRLSDAASHALSASRPRTFDASVDNFALALHTIPDYPAAEMSNETFARVNSLAEQVIAEIEHRVESETDERHREALGERVYDIRKALEEAFTWRRHYLKT